MQLKATPFRYRPNGSHNSVGSGKMKNVDTSIRLIKEGKIIGWLTEFYNGMAGLAQKPYSILVYSEGVHLKSRPP